MRREKDLGLFNKYPYTGFSIVVVMVDDPRLRINIRPDVVSSAIHLRRHKYTDNKCDDRNHDPYS